MPMHEGFRAGVNEGIAAQQSQEMSALGIEEQGLKNQQARTAISIQNKMLEKMAAMGTNGGNDSGTQADALAKDMDSLASIALSSGAPEQAKQYATAGSTIRENASKISSRQAKLEKDDWAMVDSMLPGIYDQDTLDDANATYMMKTGRPSKLAGAKYSPQLIETLKNASQTAKDKALTQEAEARARAADAQASTSRARIPLIKAQTDAAEALANARNKNGAGNLAPKAGELKIITDLMQKDFDVGTEDMASARVTARPIAERMKEIMGQNPGMSQTAAAKRAYTEAGRRGDFGGMSPNRSMPGESPKKPLALPMSGGKLDVSKLKANKYYPGTGKYAGKTYLYTGTAFVPVGSEPGEVEETDPDDEEAEE